MCVCLSMKSGRQIQAELTGLSVLFIGLNTMPSYGSALYLIMRAAMFLQHLGNNDNYKLPWMISGIVFGALSLYFALARPYKKKWMNILDSLMHALVVVNSFLLLYTVQEYSNDTHFLIYLTVYLTLIPQMVLTLYIVYKPLKRTAALRYIQRKCGTLIVLINVFCGCPCKLQTNSESELYPDRLLNPHRYRPLVLPHHRNEGHEDCASTATSRRVDTLINDRVTSEFSVLSNQLKNPVNNYGSCQ